MITAVKLSLALPIRSIYLIQWITSIVKVRVWKLDVKQFEYRWIFTCFANSVTSSPNDSEEQTSAGPPASLGVQVANSHFSKIKASNGNNGWLEQEESDVLSSFFSLLRFSCVIRIKSQEIDLSRLISSFEMFVASSHYPIRNQREPFLIPSYFDYCQINLHRSNNSNDNDRENGKEPIKIDFCEVIIVISTLLLIVVANGRVAVVMIINHCHSLVGTRWRKNVSWQTYFVAVCMNQQNERIPNRTTRKWNCQ